MEMKCFKVQTLRVSDVIRKRGAEVFPGVEWMICVLVSISYLSYFIILQDKIGPE